ncbi:MAG: pantoate--beta-alanine ligase [Candidatus Omnitrophica bacterium]|nr:pantoate--beta-alanine ligase [Candidatus Omnitrophota bacterium]
MTVIRAARRMAARSERLRRQGKQLGVVPTMGALHEGHLSLVRAAVKANDVVIVTIFVNPLQFGPHEDFRRYPRNLPRDIRLARRAGADIVFAPSVQEISPTGFGTTIDVGPIGERLEGRFRPGHFRGVATVVAALFHLTKPTHAYFGQKDYQQTLVIKRLVKDLCLDVRLHVLPTVRERDGVAMSSRNRYLRVEQRRQAAVLWRALRAGRERIRTGERRASAVAARMRRLIKAIPSARIDYVVAVDAATLAPVRRLRGCVALLVAVWIGRTRLIDNLLVDVS